MSGDLTTRDAIKIAETRRDNFLLNSSIDDKQARDVLQVLHDFHATGKPKLTSKQQGDLMEAVAHYFLENCGFFEDASSTDENEKYQIDHHTIFNERSSAQLFALYRIDCPHAVFESKNHRTEKLDVDKVHKLVGVATLLKLRVAGFFSWTALKGSDNASAVGLIDDYGHDTGKVVLLFHQPDFEFLYKYPKLFGYLFYEKLRLFYSTKKTHDVDYSNVLRGQTLYVGT